MKFNAFSGGTKIVRVIIKVSYLHEADRICLSMEVDKKWHFVSGLFRFPDASIDLVFMISSLHHKKRLHFKKFWKNAIPNGA